MHSHEAGVHGGAWGVRVLGMDAGGWGWWGGGAPEPLSKLPLSKLPLFFLLMKAIHLVAADVARPHLIVADAMMASATPGALARCETWSTPLRPC